MKHSREDQLKSIAVMAMLYIARLCKNNEAITLLPEDLPDICDAMKAVSTARLNSDAYKAYKAANVDA